MLQHSTIWREVSTWPAHERLALATHILQSLQQDENRQPVSEERKAAILSLIGIWKTEQVVDEKQILDEARMKKYG